MVRGIVIANGGIWQPRGKMGTATLPPVLWLHPALRERGREICTNFATGKMTVRTTHADEGSGARAGAWYSLATGQGQLQTLLDYVQSRRPQERTQGNSQPSGKPNKRLLRPVMPCQTRGYEGGQTRLWEVVKAGEGIETGLPWRARARWRPAAEAQTLSQMRESDLWNHAPVPLHE